MITQFGMTCYVLPH